MNKKLLIGYIVLSKFQVLDRWKQRKQHSNLEHLVGDKKRQATRGADAPLFL